MVGVDGEACKAGVGGAGLIGLQEQFAQQPGRSHDLRAGALAPADRPLGRPVLRQELAPVCRDDRTTRRDEPAPEIRVDLDELETLEQKATGRSRRPLWKAVR